MNDNINCAPQECDETQEILIDMECRLDKLNAVLKVKEEKVKIIF